ncbi:MAG: HIT family protein [Prevotellaceae bacterium]|jgi:histidine triad (HIT) family protein|nr:HIT family protein [Prevotellaceae bacterium]
MSSIFSKIIAGEIPSHKIAEDDRFFAFLDINPVQQGHVLVIPKTEVDYLFDLDDDTLAGINVFAKKIAIALKKAIPCQRIAVLVLGMEVPHAHIHLIPINKESDLDIRKKIATTQEELAEVAAKIRAELTGYSQ